MTFTAFCQWLANTGLSTAMHESEWAEPLFEGTHVLALTLFFGFTAMLDLRLLGLLYKRRRASEVHDQLVPWMKGAFAIMVISGVLLWMTDPLTFYSVPVFKIKFILLLLAGVNIWIFNHTLRGKFSEWDLGDTPVRAKVAAICSLSLWIGVIATGRLVAYLIPPP